MDTGNRKTVFYITHGGHLLASRLKGLYPGLTVLRFTKKGVEKAWQESKALLFIMAAGIVVRTLSAIWVPGQKYVRARTGRSSPRKRASALRDHYHTGSAGQSESIGRPAWIRRHLVIKKYLLYIFGGPPCAVLPYCP